MNKRQIVLLVSQDYAGFQYPNQAPCYKRVITSQHMAVTVPKGESVRKSVNEETAFLRTFRHRFSSMGYYNWSQLYDGVEVCVHKTASLQITGLVDRGFKHTVCRPAFSPFESIGNHELHRKDILTYIFHDPGQEELIIHFGLKKAPGQPRIQATYIHYPQNVTRGFVYASLGPNEPGPANDPRQSAQALQYVNLFDFRGHLLTLSLLVGKVNLYMTVHISSNEQGTRPRVHVLCSVEAPGTHDAVPSSKWIRRGTCRSVDFWIYLRRIVSYPRARRWDSSTFLEDEDVASD